MSTEVIKDEQHTTVVSRSVVSAQFGELNLCGCKKHQHLCDYPCRKIRKADGTALTLEQVWQVLNELAEAKCATGSADPLTIPEALYSCQQCREDHSWPARNIYWSARCGAWICNNCWDHLEHGEPGIRLDREIGRQTAKANEQAQARPGRKEN